MNITVLAENVSDIEGVEAQHGLSLYIESGGKKILFDMGQDGLFAKNAQVLKKDISAVDIAVISHGHYDHGGGLAKFLEMNCKAPVYINSRAFEPHYNGTEKYIGLDDSLLKSDRLVFTDDSLSLGEEMELFTCNENPGKYPNEGKGLNMLCEGELVPDDFRHEQYMLIRENSKRILISGCSHKGILNIMDWVKPDVLIGGFHLRGLELSGEDRLRLDNTADILARYNTKYYTCHCTGCEQYEYLKERMGEKLSYLSCGKTIEI